MRTLFCYNLIAILILVLFCCSPASTTLPRHALAPVPQKCGTSQSSAINYLADVMDQFHSTLNVYTEVDAAGNHFVARARMPENVNKFTVPLMNEVCTLQPHSGYTCIRAKFQTYGDNWGGWYMVNGVLSGDEHQPKPNWGDQPNSGIDLTGATCLKFWARGEQGEERVEFFALGVGRDDKSGMAIRTYPDSSPKITTGIVTLSTDWTQYTIDLHENDLTYVLGGFGWVASARQNRYKNITFYLDDIRYDKDRSTVPRFLLSFQTIPSSKFDFDRVMRNVAFTYDNAVALFAFLAAGYGHRAGLIADAFVYAIEHDRYYTDGRVRNAYQAGDIALPRGWTPHGRAATVCMPGWYERYGDDRYNDEWKEDEFQASTHTGNVAWVMMALLGYYETYGGKKYLRAAEKMGEWVEINTRSEQGYGGYTGGFEGWETNPKALNGPEKLSYKATEHNIDLFSAFLRLYIATKNPLWRERAMHAKQFVIEMWDKDQGKFWTGTKLDGITINRSIVPVDIQAWAIMAFGDEGRPYWSALNFVENNHRVGWGYDFKDNGLKYGRGEGIWYEGTAQMALSYNYTGKTSKWKALVERLKEARQPDGSLIAADRDELWTGYLLPNKNLPPSSSNKWYYFRRSHIAATGWLVLAECGYNPFGVAGKSFDFVAASITHSN